VGEALGLGDPNAVFEDGLARGDVDGELAEGAVAVLPTVVFLGQHLEAEIVDRLGEGRVDLECVAAERNRPGRAWHLGHRQFRCGAVVVRWSLQDDAVDLPFVAAPVVGHDDRADPVPDRDRADRRQHQRGRIFARSGAKARGGLGVGRHAGSPMRAAKRTASSG
jgi:hypothetical protein